MKLRRTVFLGLMCVGMLVLAAPAWAANPAQNAYDTFSKFSTDGSSLPFTGVDVGAVAMIGLVLVGAGLVVRRRVSTRTD